MIKDIDKVKKARAQIKGQVTKIESFLKNNLEISSRGASSIEETR